MTRAGRHAGQSTTAAVVTLLALALCALTLSQLLLSSDGLRKTRDLQQAVSETRLENDALARRNAALAAEVNNLKRGLEAAEERARADLGMIGENESFYQVVAGDATQ